MSSFENVIDETKMQVIDQIDQLDEALSGEEKTETITKCICGFLSSQPYDTSVFPNNDTTYYTQIGYNKIKTFTKLLEEDKCQSETYDMNMLYILDCFSDPKIEIIFRFLCSPECRDGINFVDTKTTEDVYNFIKLVTSKRSVLIEVGDHSMASVFNNWSEEVMGMPSPIVIEKKTTHGLFKMTATKENFLNSAHPTLKQIGDMSASDNIEISFNNMGGTKIFSVVESVADLCGLKVVSTGISCEPEFPFRRFGEDKLNAESDKFDFQQKQIMPVHCEFNYGMGKFVVSATHWCNLDQVDTPIDLPKLRRYCTDVLGREATANFDYSISSAVDEYELKREISHTVRGISSGGGSMPPKKIKIGISDSSDKREESNSGSISELIVDSPFPFLSTQLPPLVRQNAEVSQQTLQTKKTFDDLIDCQDK
jgi:hypothetical protein